MIKRNDVAAAIALYREGVLDGTWRPESGQGLAMMFDSDRRRELFAELDRVNAEPEIAEALAKFQE